MIPATLASGLLTLAVVTGSLPSITPTPTPPSPAIMAEAKDDKVRVEANLIDPGMTPSTSGPAVYDWARLPACPIRGSAEVAGQVAVIPCTDPPAEPVLACSDGSAPIDPLWVRSRADEDDEWGPWQVVALTWCTATTGVTPELVLTEFRRLPLPAPTLTMQPDRGWVLVNMRTIVYTDPTPADFDLTLLGIPVHLTATPATYTWTWHDGATTTTTSPGHPWPDDDVSHVYDTLATRQITLTTTWTATYTLGTDPTMHTVPGTATTTATGPDFTVDELRTHLVADTCDQDPYAPGC